MTRYRCRIARPTLSGWREIEAETPEEAANSLHLESDLHDSTSYVLEKDGQRAKVHFARVEVEGHRQQWISRVYTHGIYRSGGVRRGAPSLADIAERLDWAVEPEEMLSAGWESEESTENAGARVKSCRR